MRGNPARWPALLLCALFLALQIGGLDYGTTINNLPHIADYRINSAGSAAAALQRRNLYLDRTTLAESPDKRMLRFKLYSVESDEVLSIMMLARMRPAKLRLDPGLFVYGGSYLYPLGAWYFTLAKLGIIKLGPLAAMAAAPDRMDAVYIYGRLFVLLAVIFSALVFFASARRLVPPATALILLALYLSAPATIVFSQQMKPHWYALLWSNIAVLMVVRLYQNRGWRGLELAAAGTALGLAVGSAATYAIFAILLWLAVVLAVRRGSARWRDLAILPAVALVAFAVTNPYVFINWNLFVAERQQMTTQWFAFTLEPKYLWLFVRNSLLPGLGVALGIAVMGAAVWQLVRGAALERWTAAGLLATIVAVGYFTASLSGWHINLRYAPYLLPVGLLFIGTTLGARRNLVLGAILVLTLAQTAPMWLATRDEDSPRHSTRLAAARWIGVNIPAGAAVRVESTNPAPFEVPPFDFARYRINTKDWRFQVVIERLQSRVRTPPGTTLVKRFTPRLSTTAFPFVYGHINPQISIYRRN